MQTEKNDCVKMILTVKKTENSLRVAKISELFDITEINLSITLVSSIAAPLPIIVLADCLYV